MYKYSLLNSKCLRSNCVTSHLSLNTVWGDVWQAAPRGYQMDRESSTRVAGGPDHRWALVAFIFRWNMPLYFEAPLLIYIDIPTFIDFNLSTQPTLSSPLLLEEVENNCLPHQLHFQQLILDYPINCIFEKLVIDYPINCIFKKLLLITPSTVFSMPLHSGVCARCPSKGLPLCNWGALGRGFARSEGALLKCSSKFLLEAKAPKIQQIQKEEWLRGWTRGQSFF